MTTLLAVYLWINAALYAGFGALCILRTQPTAKALGFEVLAPHGVVEYATVYGGMQLGFAAFFALGAWRGGEFSVWTLWFALCIYLGIVLVRWTSILLTSGAMPGTTWALAAMEVVLLLAAVYLAWAQRV